MKTLISLSLMALALGACGSSSPPSTVASSLATTAVSRDFDLTDPAIQAEIGSPPFQPVGWQRFVGPFTAIGDTALPNPSEVELMTAAAADVPEVLAAPVRNIVRTADAPESHLDTSLAVAVALGPDIYLLDRVFTLEGGTTRYAVAYAINHEITHVHQWMALDNDYLNAAAAGQVARLDLSAGSTAVRVFAEAVGWEDSANDPLAPDWAIGTATPATAYGATNPAEDMAEAVALATSGRGNWLDQAHRDWAETFTGLSVDELGAGQPWVPSGGGEINSTDLLYDVEAVAAAAGDRTHIEPTYFQVPAQPGDAEAIAAEIATRLTDRGLTGTLSPIPDDRLLRIGGLFERDDGAGWWVEVWDFPSSDLDQGDEAVVVSYVMLW